MPRAKAILQSDFPYNITARCINKEWFNIEMPQVWRIFCEELNKTALDHKLLIHSFVLMNNHFHLIASTPEANISQCMQQFMVRSSRRLTRAGNRINETFAGRHFKCILNHPNYYLNAYKYNYRNPVDAGICERAEQYPFSSLQFVLGLSPRLFPMAEDTTFISDPYGTLEWLKKAPEARRLEGFRFGIKHAYFKSKKCSKTDEFLIKDSETL
jgi:putative transposase